MLAILTSGLIESTARNDVAAVVEESNADRGSGGDVAKNPFFSMWAKVGTVCRLKRREMRWTGSRMMK